MKRTRPKIAGFERQSAFFKSDGDYDILVSPELPSDEYIFGVELNPNSPSISSPTRQGTKHIQYETKFIPNPFDYAIVFFNWGPENGSEADSRLMVLNPPRYVDVGWSREAADPISSGQITNPNEYYIGHILGRDTTGNQGPEIFFINFKKLLDDYPEVNVFNIDFRSFWYGSSFSNGGDGVLSVDVTTYLGGILAIQDAFLGSRNAGVYVNIGGEATNSFNYTLRLTTDGVGQNVPGEEIGVLSYNRQERNAAFLPYPQNFYYPESIVESISASGEVKEEIQHTETSRGFFSPDSFNTAFSSPTGTLEHRVDQLTGYSVGEEINSSSSPLVSVNYNNGELYLSLTEQSIITSTSLITEVASHREDLVEKTDNDTLLISPYLPSSPIYYQLLFPLNQTLSENFTGDSSAITTSTYIHEVGGEYSLSESLLITPNPSQPLLERFFTDPIPQTQEQASGGANVINIEYRREP